MVEDGQQGKIEKNSAEKKQAHQPLVFVGILRHIEVSLFEPGHGSKEPIALERARTAKESGCTGTMVEGGSSVKHLIAVHSAEKLALSL